jgi:succinyl-diaminopimelate desuccinylase
MFNVRNSTLTDETAVKNFTQNALKTAAIDGYELSIKTSSNAFINRDERLIGALSESIKKHTGASPKLSTSGGTSDARFFAAHKIAVAEFGVINDLIHAANESVSIEEVRGLTLIFSDLIKRIGEIEI